MPDAPSSTDAPSPDESSAGMKDALRRYIANNLMDADDTALSDDANLLGDGLIDSIGIMSLLTFIENEFDVRVPPEDVTIEHFASVNTIHAYLERRRSDDA
jgi:acyl carrier protein